MKIKQEPPFCIDSIIVGKTRYGAIFFKKVIKIDRFKK